MFKKLILPLIVLSVLIASIAMALLFDKYLAYKEVESIISSTANTFVETVSNENIEVYSTLNDLPKPAACAPEIFRELTLKNKHIKNIGVIDNNIIRCDVYEGSGNREGIDFKTFTNELGDTYKYWKSNDYVGIAAPSGYFVEYDQGVYLNFKIPSQISGLFMVGRQSKDVWFSYQQEDLSKEDIQLINKVMKDAVQNYESMPSFKQVVTKNNFFYKLSIVDKGTIIGVFSKKANIDLHRKINLLNILYGLILGLSLAYFFTKIYIKNQTLRSMLKKAIRNKSLIMAYQPLVDLKDEHKTFKGFEALVRWQLNTGDWIRPDVFIPVAEQNGLTHALTKLIINMVFEDLHKILQSKPELYVAINITASDLYDNHLLDAVIINLSKYKLNSSNIVFELTERVPVNDATTTAIEAIRKAGIRISIDDFGTGSSNVKYLADLKPDIIKIDRAFVVWSDSDGPTSQLLARLISLGREFNLTVVVEGVETQEQAIRCQALGADVGQGYYWSKPLTPAEISKIKFK